MSFTVFHDYFHQLFSRMETRNMKLLEIGCARSAWAALFGDRNLDSRCLELTTQDTGCSQSKHSIRREIEGEVLCEDFFSPPESMIEAFDVVISFGVVEHFPDTSECLRAFSRFLKPGGLSPYECSNLAGLNGLIQKIVNRPGFDVHVLWIKTRWPMPMN